MAYKRKIEMALWKGYAAGFVVVGLFGVALVAVLPVTAPADIGVIALLAVGFGIMAVRCMRVFTTVPCEYCGAELLGPENEIRVKTASHIQCPGCGENLEV